MSASITQRLFARFIDSILVPISIYIGFEKLHYPYFLIVLWGIQIYLYHNYAQSIGKKLSSIYIHDVILDVKANVFKCISRDLFYLLTQPIDIAYYFFNNKNQMLHDYIFSTRVLKC